MSVSEVSLLVRSTVAPCQFIASEASFLVCSMARIFAIYIYIFQSIRHAVNILNVYT